MIYISELSKTFSGQKVLNNLSLEIQKGEVVALIGSSGAGKSTFLRSLNYLEAPDSGRIKIDDFEVDFEHISQDQILTLRRKLAMVFQQFNLFGRKTALENVKEGLIVVKGLSDQEATKQRVALARALAMKPEVLLLDEPTSALDPELVGEVEKSIANAAKSGQTMVLVSHDMSFVAQVADKVLFLDKGRIIESGTPEEIMQHPKEERTKEFFASYKRTYV